MANKTQKVTIQVDVKHAAALQKLVDDLHKLGGQFPKAAKAAQGFSKSVKQTQIEARKGGRHLQNFSYQMQDIIVQTSNGTSVMRSLSQQLPQMLIGFGKWGAVIGVVAAGLPIIIQGMGLLDDKTISLEDSTDGLNEAMDNLFKTTEDINFTKWVDEWNKASAAVRNTMLAVLEFELELSRRAFGQNLDSIAAAGGDLVGTSFWEAFNFKVQDGVETAKAIFNNFVEESQRSVISVLRENFNGTDDNLARSLGIDEDSLRYLQELNRIYDEGKLSIDNYAAGVKAVIKANEGAAESITKVLRASEAAITQRDKLVAAREKAAEASGGGTLTGGSTAKAVKVKKSDIFGPGRKEFREQIALDFKNAAAEAKKLEAVYNSLYPAAAKYRDEVLLLKYAKDNIIITQDAYNKKLAEAKTAYEAAINGPTLAAEATDIFLATFDTAVNGVAQGTQSMSDAFESMTKAILLQIGKLLAIRAIGTMLSGTGGGSGFFADLGASLLGSTAAKGNVYAGGNHLTAYAKGGVVSGPTLFPMKNGAGLMGEAGAEAVMPLTRMSNGNLGVESSGMNVVINNNAPGVDIRPRQTDQGLTIDVVMSAISQAVNRGGNPVSESIERSYALNRGRAVYGN